MSDDLHPVGSPSAGLDPSAADAPAWFRSVVWSSLSVALTRLMPIPFLDDLIAGRLRRSMVRRLTGKRAIVLARPDVRRLAGGARRTSCLGMIGKTIVYPFRKVLKKVLYFLSIKEALDTFSRVFHQGYLLHTAVAAGALGRGGVPVPEAVDRVEQAVFETLEATDTAPLENTARGVFRHSRELVRGLVRWARRRLPTRAGSRAVDEAGQSVDELSTQSPEAEALLDRLLVVLWGKRDYRLELEHQLALRLGRLPSPPPGD